MIAYHFPPSAEVSGALRTLSMANHLAASGYEPLILTPKRLAYPRVTATVPALSEKCEVVRTFALDAARHMGFFGRYPKHLAQPDRWVSWWLSAVPRGLILIKRYKPRVLWSTYPIATSHLIASTLHRLTGIPWIADFRDPMVLQEYQIPKETMASRERLERVVVRKANACVFVTQQMINHYAKRYEKVEHGHFVLIPNGYDEESFVGLDDKIVTSTTDIFDESEPKRPLVLVHSGLLYPCGRNPWVFFEAISNLLLSGRISGDTLHIVLRASGSSELYSNMISKLNLNSIFELAPMLERPDALLELNNADGVLIFQGREFNTQVPAKIYEYFRVGKPILAMVDKAGETAEVLERERVGVMVDINSALEIENGVLKIIEMITHGSARRLEGDELKKYSREVGANKLRRLIETLVSV